MFFSIITLVRGDIMRADFHMHSIHSDGTKTQRELFQIAKAENVDYISITDHDTCLNVNESFQLAKEYGVKFIPGIELSTIEQGKPVHLLGYFRDESYKNNEMISYYKMIKQGREQRTNEFIKKLREHFQIEITYESVKSESNGIIARPHIAKAINKKYPEYSFDYIFDNFIGDHSKAFVPSTELSVTEGIELLRRNNCLVILAHPTLLKEKIYDNVMSYKYDGLEAVYFRNKETDEEKFRNVAKEKNMIISGGSDYHGIKDDSKHGYIGEINISDTDLEVFLQKYNK